MKKSTALLTAITLVTLTAGLVIAEINSPETVTFSPKIGTVTFNHAAHLAVTDCAGCHHTGEYVTCSSCHGVQSGIANTKDAFHGSCIECHKQQQGPKGCKDCHIK